MRVDRLFDPVGTPRLADVNWAGFTAFFAGIVATWLFMYGLIPAFQGPVAVAMGGVDLSWLAGGLTSALVYALLGPVAAARATTPTMSRSAARTAVSAPLRAKANVPTRSRTRSSVIWPVMSVPLALCRTLSPPEPCRVASRPLGCPDGAGPAGGLDPLVRGVVVVAEPISACR